MTKLTRTQTRFSKTNNSSVVLRTNSSISRFVWGSLRRLWSKPCWTRLKMLVAKTLITWFVKKSRLIWTSAVTTGKSFSEQRAMDEYQFRTNFSTMMASYLTSSPCSMLWRWRRILLRSCSRRGHQPTTCLPSILRRWARRTTMLARRAMQVSLHVCSVSRMCHRKRRVVSSRTGALPGKNRSASPGKTFLLQSLAPPPTMMVYPQALRKNDLADSLTRQPIS